MSKKALPILVFAYSDYRILLFDLFNAWQKKFRPLSYRKFSEQAGFSVPNFLKLVIDGKRNLSHESIQKITAFFDFNKKETFYFENLVFMNQANTHEQKNYYYKRLGKTPGYKLIRKTDANIYEYYSHWYYPAIREMVTMKNFTEDPTWIAAHLSPQVPEKKVAEAFQRLIDMEMIVQKEGAWTQADPILSTGPSINSLAIMNYHKEMIQHAGFALDNIHRDRRNVSSLTVAISEEVYIKMIQETYSFHQRLLELAESDTKRDHVYQLNFQMFPLTQDDEGATK